MTTSAAFDDEVGALTRITWATAIGLAYCALEAGAGLWGNSSALVADAAHNLLDAFALAGLGLTRLLAGRTPSPRFTFGLRNASILLALANAALLLATAGGIAADALNRLITPQPVSGGLVAALAAIGILANGVAAWLLDEDHPDLNHRSTRLHLLADAGVSCALLVGGAAIALSDCSRIDGVVGLTVGGLVAYGAWPLLKEAGYAALAAAPAHADPVAVRTFLERQHGVVEVHDLHIWPIGTSETALTCHLVMPEGFPGDSFVVGLHQELKTKFRIDRATLQIELGQG